MSESITRDLRGYVVTFGDNKIVCYGVLQVMLLCGHHYRPPSSSSSLLSVSSWLMQMSVKESMTMSTRMFFSSNRSKIQQWMIRACIESADIWPAGWMNVPWGQTLIHNNDEGEYMQNMFHLNLDHIVTQKRRLLHELRKRMLNKGAFVETLKKTL